MTQRITLANPAKASGWPACCSAAMVCSAKPRLYKPRALRLHTSTANSPSTRFQLSRTVMLFSSLFTLLSSTASLPPFGWFAHKRSSPSAFGLLDML
ncbi:hypothetical protein D3C78_1134830 [compost metagenome]